VLPLWIEFYGLPERVGRVVQLALREVQLPACLVRPREPGINGEGALDAGAGLVETAEPDERACGEAEEIRVVGVPVEEVGTDGFGRLDLAALQESLGLLELLCCFLGNRRSPSVRRRNVTALGRTHARGLDRGRYRFELAQ
jgi:hypothetical protein